MLGYFGGKNFAMRRETLCGLICLVVAGCSTTAHHTNVKAAMAGLNWAPEQCAPIGSVYYDCGSTHALPGASQGLTGAESSNDAQAIRGICATGYSYVQGKGCQPVGATPVLAAKASASPVLNLCADPARPADQIASMPGYTQMAVDVSGASGEAITGLKKTDFVAWDGSVNLPIVFFRADRSHVPVSTVIVIDESGSMGRKLVAPLDQLPAIRAKIDAVVEKLNRCDELAMISAGGVRLTNAQIAEAAAGNLPNISNASATRKITVLEPFTTDHVAPTRDLYRYTPYGQTAIYDALNKAIAMLAKAHYRSRAIVLITDGIDNSSTLALDRVIADAQQLGVRIFAVGIGDPQAPQTEPAARLDRQSLVPITRDTGGALFTADDVSKDDGASLAAALGKISDALGSGYTVGVIVPSAGKPRRRLPNVGVANDSSAVVRAYAEPPAEAVKRVAGKSTGALHL